jgi:hypothetical protein
MFTKSGFFKRTIATVRGAAANALPMATWRKRSVLACRVKCDARDALARKLYLTVDCEQVKVGDHLGSGIDKSGYKARCEIDLPGVPRGNPVCYKAANHPDNGGRLETAFLASCTWNDQIWGELVIWSLLRLGFHRKHFAGVIALVERDGHICGYLCEFCTGLDYGQKCEIDGGGEWRICSRCSGKGEHRRSTTDPDGTGWSVFSTCPHCEGECEVRGPVDCEDAQGLRDQYRSLLDALEPIGIADQHSENIGLLNGELVTLDYGLGSCWNLDCLEQLATELEHKVKDTRPTTPHQVTELAGGIYRRLFE